MKKETLFETRDNRMSNAGNSSETVIKGYEATFLFQPKSTSRKQTYISCGIYSQLNNILPIVGNGISVPTFLNNVLEHHLRTHKNEIEELFHSKIRKIQQIEPFIIDEGEMNDIGTPAKEFETGSSFQSDIERYENNFLIRQKMTQRRQTYINCDLHSKLSCILPVLESDMSIPTFLNNILEHHLKTYKNEIGELFHDKVLKVKF